MSDVKTGLLYTDKPGWAQNRTKSSVRIFLGVIGLLLCMMLAHDADLKPAFAGEFPPQNTMAAVDPVASIGQDRLGTKQEPSATDPGPDVFFRRLMLPVVILLAAVFAFVLITIFIRTPKADGSAKTVPVGSPLTAASPGGFGCHVLTAEDRPISRPGRILVFFKKVIENLHPSYFAMVMSTGIVSIAIYYQGAVLIAKTLFALNIVAYLVLGALYIARMFLFTDRFRNDFQDHTVGMGFFTAVVASSVLGSQTLLLAGCFAVAGVLWSVTLALWLCLTYGVFTGLITKEKKPGIAEGINGGWLLAIVATQAVSVLSSALAPFFILYRELMLFLALIAWLFGGMLYIWVISLIFYRYLFFQFSPQDLTPPYWINMGAVAISTLGGVGLIAQTAPQSFLFELLPFLKGLTLLFWATATWWIPMLLILGIWRHGYRGLPLTYNPLFWGAVFPLGMYTTCTHRLAEAVQVPILAIIPKGFVFLAAAAWIGTFAGMMYAIWTGWHRS